MSAALAACVAGPFLIVPLAERYGRSSIIFWSVFSVLICNIWAPLMTKPDQYIPYVMSRLFSGFGSTVPSVMGVRVLTDMFFIHERGRVFSIFHLVFLFGPVGGPTVGGFIAAKHNWPNMFWWTDGLLIFTLICMFCFLHETGYERDGGEPYPEKPKSFLANRLATFLPGSRVVPKQSFSHVAKHATMPFLIGAAPATIIIGLFAFISFGFQLMLTVIQNVFLQEPIFIGGYGFTLQQNAICEYPRCMLCFLEKKMLISNRLLQQLGRPGPRPSIWPPPQ